MVTFYQTLLSFDPIHSTEVSQSALVELVVDRFVGRQTMPVIPFSLDDRFHVFCTGLKAMFVSI